MPACLVNGDPVDIGVVHKPNNLVAEKFTVVLRRQIRLGRFAAIQLQALPDSLSQHVQGRIGLHYFSHGLLNKWFAT